jgi:hypothetical protein
MISRREAIGGGVVGAIAGALSSASTAEAAPALAEAAGAAADDQLSAQALNRIAGTIGTIRDDLRSERQFSELGAIREAQKAFLRSNNKWPDYIEVGTDPYFAIYDWHIRWQQPLTLGRDPIGRYTIMLMQTMLILRADVAASYVGQPYDNR